MVDTSRRCDGPRCGAQAYWSTWVDMTELTWCNHHFREYEVKLRATAMAVIDHTWEMGEDMSRIEDLVQEQADPRETGAN